MINQHLGQIWKEIDSLNTLYGLLDKKRWLLPSFLMFFPCRRQKMTLFPCPLAEVRRFFHFRWQLHRMGNETWEAISIQTKQSYQIGLLTQHFISIEKLYQSWLTFFNFFISSLSSIKLVISLICPLYNCHLRKF